MSAIRYFHRHAGSEGAGGAGHPYSSNHDWVASFVRHQARLRGGWGPKGYWLRILESRLLLHKGISRKKKTWKYMQTYGRSTI